MAIVDSDLESLTDEENDGERDLDEPLMPTFEYYYDITPSGEYQGTFSWFEMSYNRETTDRWDVDTSEDDLEEDW